MLPPTQINYNYFDQKFSFISNIQIENSAGYQSWIEQNLDISTLLTFTRTSKKQ